MSGLFNKVNPFRLFSSWFEKHPWIRRFLFVLPILLVLSLLTPVLSLVEKLIDITYKLLGPALETPFGRAVFLVIVLGVFCLLVYVFAKERIFELFRKYALATHLRALEALLQGDRDAARRGFRRVLRLGRLIDLSKGSMKGYGSLVADARIKLARMAFEDGDLRGARSHLARITGSETRKRLALSLAELNARIFCQHPDHLPESVRLELEESHRTWPGHLGIARLLADKLIAMGDSERAVEVLESTHRKASKAESPRAGAVLARLLLELAEKALHEGQLKEAQAFLKRSLRLDESEEGLLLKADLHLAREDLEAALSVLGQVRSPASKERFAVLLREEGIPVDPRKLLEHVPRMDSLVAVAEFYLERGEARRAARALELCLRSGAANPRVLVLLASLKLGEGQKTDAEETLKLAFRAIS